MTAAGVSATPSPAKGIAGTSTASLVLLASGVLLICTLSAFLISHLIRVIRRRRAKAGKASTPKPITPAAEAEAETVTPSEAEQQQEEQENEEAGEGAEEQA